VAEGLLDGILGGEEDAPEVEGAAESLIAADAFAAAVAADQAKADPEVARATSDFLRDQSRLLRVQTHHLEAEHPFRLTQLEHQSREGGLRGIGQLIRIIMQLLAALAAAIFVGLLLAMVIEALWSQSVIVDPFDAPAALAGRGLTGKVVASGVLDELSRLQAATHGSVAKRDLSNAWTGDIKVEVPETGLSIGDIDRMLKERFGHDIHIEGDLIQTDAGGLALTVRGDDVPAKTFTGASGDLDKLTTSAAEYIYGRSQPRLFAIYLLNTGRAQDALAFLPGAFARATTDAERAELANNWGNAYSTALQAKAAVEKYRLAMSMAPPRSPIWWKAWGNLVANMTRYQGEEAAWREARAYLEAMSTASSSEKPELRLAAAPAGVAWDLPLALAADLANAARKSGAGATVQIDGPQIADAYGPMHDPTQAARYMAASDPDDASTKAEALLLQAYAALDAGDGAAAIAPMEAFQKAWQADPNLQFSYADSPCLLGRAYGLAGRLADAEVLFKQAGPWSRCYAFHGEALERAGDLPGAQQVWAQGLATSPDLPFVYMVRGVSEMTRGDLKAAEADLATAAAKAPHYADPLKAWGDLKAREGRWKEALAKYDQALKYAPAWRELHQAREAAARRS